MLTTLFCKAQERSSLAISYGFGNGVIGSIYKGGYSGSFKQKSLNIYGLNYWHEIGGNLYFETGMQLIRCHYLSTNIPPNSIQTNNVRNMISVPFKLRFEAGGFIFFNGG